MSGLYSPFEEKLSIVATGGLQPVFTFHSAGQEGRRRRKSQQLSYIRKSVLARSSILKDECIFYMSAADEE